MQVLYVLLFLKLSKYLLFPNYHGRYYGDRALFESYAVYS